jgi:hypothetical protein
MANELNGFIPTLYAALNIVSRELVGFIPSVARNLKADVVSIGQELLIPVARSRGTQDISPGNEPVGSGNDFDKVSVKITKQKSADPIIWDGDEENGVGEMLDPMQVDQAAEAMRTITNEIEDDLAQEAVGGAIGVGNVYGVAGTPPFNGSLADMAQVRKIMQDIGAPRSGRQFVANTTVGAQLLSLTQLTNVSKAGSDRELRQGEFNPLMGFTVWESGGFSPIEPGNGSGYLLNGAAAVGAKELIVDTGTGAFNMGAIITIGADPNQYVVAEDFPSGGTTLKIVGGLKVAAVDNAAIAVSTSILLPSMAFTRNAILLATRVPYIPRRGDKALDTTTITDPVSGLSFQVAIYPDYLQNRIEIRACWGVKSIKPKHSVCLFG